MARKKVPTAPALNDWNAVDAALHEIRECSHSITELGVERDRQIDSIKEDYARQLLPFQNKIKGLEADIRAFVDAHRAELVGKSRILNFGVVGYRISHKLMLPSSRIPDAIATLKALGRAELIKVTESLDREALKKQPAELLEQVGAYIRPSDEFYYSVDDPKVDV